MTARFFYDLSSSYAYLAARRVDDLLPGEVEWCPIAFGPLLVATRRVPWSLTPGEREEGMRECERRAAEYGLPPMVFPAGWPAETYTVDLPRAALAAKREGRERELSLAIFEQIFVHGRRMDDPALLDAAAEQAGVAKIREAIADPAVKQALRDRTDEAMAVGVVGVPTVEAAGELFWGDDRLEDAAAALSRPSAA